MHDACLAQHTRVLSARRHCSDGVSAPKAYMLHTCFIAIVIYEGRGPWRRWSARCPGGGCHSWRVGMWVSTCCRIYIPGAVHIQLFGWSGARVWVVHFVDSAGICAVHPVCLRVCVSVCLNASVRSYVLKNCCVISSCIPVQLCRTDNESFGTSKHNFASSTPHCGGGVYRKFRTVFCAVGLNFIVMTSADNWCRAVYVCVCVYFVFDYNSCNTHTAHVRISVGWYTSGAVVRIKIQAPVVRASGFKKKSYSV